MATPTRSGAPPARRWISASAAGQARQVIISDRPVRRGPGRGRPTEGQAAQAPARVDHLPSRQTRRPAQGWREGDLPLPLDRQGGPLQMPDQQAQRSEPATRRSGTACRRATSTSRSTPVGPTGLRGPPPAYRFRVGPILEPGPQQTCAPSGKRVPGPAADLARSRRPRRPSLRTRVCAWVARRDEVR